MSSKKQNLRHLTGETFRSKDDVTDYVSSKGLYGKLSDELNRIVRSRENFPQSSWSPRTTFLDEYKEALVNILTNPETTR